MLWISSQAPGFSKSGSPLFSLGRFCVFCILLTLPTALAASTPTPSLPAADLPLDAQAGTSSLIPVSSATAPTESLDRLLATRWDSNQGLLTNTLLDVAQDREGFLWLASYEGLIRFDGLNFLLFNRASHPNLTNSALTHLHQGADGEIWVGTQGSGAWYLDRFDLEQVFQEPTGGKVLSLLPEPDGTLWVGMSSGLWVQEEEAQGQKTQGEPGTFEAFRPGALDGVGISSLFRDNAGVLWLVSEEKGLGRMDPDGVHWLDDTGRLVGPSEMVVDERGTFWIATLDGLWTWDGSEFGTIEAFQGFAVNSLAFDQNGLLWLAGRRGLGRYDPRTGSAEILLEANGTPFRSLSAIAFDLEGSVWLTSSSDGLIQLRPSSFRGLDRNSGLASTRVSAVLEEPSGSWLVGMDSGAIHRVTWPRNGKATVEDLDLKTDLEGVRIWDFTRDRQGALWISTFSGLLRLKGNEERLWTLQDGLPSPKIRTTFEDSRGGLWIGTNNAGLWWLKNPDTLDFEIFDTDNGMPGSLVFSIQERSDGDLLVGTMGGLIQLSPSGDGWRIADSGADIDLPGNVVFNALQDSGSEHIENLWVATGAGLGRVEGDGSFKVEPEDGLPAEGIFDVRRDDFGSLWMSTALGVVQVEEVSLLSYLRDPPEAPKPRFRMWTEQEGMTHRQNTAPVPMTKLQDGRLIFATHDGISILDPQSLPKESVVTPVIISSIRVDGEPLKLRDSVQVEAGKHELEIEFAALSFIRSNQVDLRFKLEGFDPDWIPAGDRRRARYTNLDPGTYRFRVIGANGDGVWNLEGDSLELVQKAHFYQNLWFQMTCVGLVLVFLGQIIRRRMQLVQGRNTELQRIVERQRRTAKQNDRLIRELETKNEELERFTYTVSHDLKSPLVTIRGFAGAAKKGLESGDVQQTDEDLDMVLGASEKMADLLKELLKLTRVGHLDNPPEEVSVTEVAKQALTTTAGAAQESGAVIKVQPDLPAIWMDRPRIMEVFQNLIENALKFSRPGTSPHIEIGAESKNDEVIYYVRDNGIGIAPEHQEQIFGLFKRLDLDAEGSGAGLAIVKRSIEKHRGRIWVESEGRDQGTTFYFTLPGIRRPNRNSASNELS